MRRNRRGAPITGRRRPSNLREHCHRLVRVPAPAQEVGHQSHRTIDVLEERHVAGAEVVQPGLAVRCGQEAVLWTLTMTRESHAAVTAVLRQRVAFGEPELPLLRGSAASNICT